MPSSDFTFDLPSKSEEVLDFLDMRRSNLAKAMSGPGPGADERARILSIAARVPDHRKLAPWRFIIFEGEGRKSAGQHLGAIFKKKNSEMPLDRAIFEGDRFLRAPLVVAVVSSPKDCKRGTPLWEQQLSSAAVCFNMCLAAQASGFAAQWLTEWYAYDEEVQQAFGLEAHEQFSGFIYIGTAQEPSRPRPRPDVDDITIYWS